MTEKHALAAGENVALNSLVRIQSITVTGDNRPFPPPQVIPHGFPGVRHKRFNGLGYLCGFAYLEWLFSVLTYNQYMYLRNTYCGGGFSGLITVFTAISGTDFDRYNAVIDVPETGVIQDAFFAPHPVSVKISRLRYLGA